MAVESQPGPSPSSRAKTHPLAFFCNSGSSSLCDAGDQLGEVSVHLRIERVVQLERGFRVALALSEMVCLPRLWDNVRRRIAPYGFDNGLFPMVRHVHTMSKIKLAIANQLQFMAWQKLPCAAGQSLLGSLLQVRVVRCTGLLTCSGFAARDLGGRFAGHRVRNGDRDGEGLDETFGR